MNKLEKLILEAYSQVQEETKKAKDLPKAFVNAIQRKHGEIHPDDFFSDDLTTYFKFTNKNKTTGQIDHKVIKLPSFEKMYDEFQDIVNDIKNLMGNPDVRQDKAARELFELIRTNFRKLQRYLRTERPDQYAIIRGRASIAELHEMFVSHASLIKEEKQNWKQVGDTVYVKNVFGDEPKEKPKYDPKKGLTDLQKFIFKYELDISDKESAKKHLGDIQQLNSPDDVYDYYANDRGWEGEMDDDLNNIYKQVKKRFSKVNESLWKEIEEAEEEPTPEEEPDTAAPEETVLEDATDKILGKFPTVKAAIIKLQTEQFKEFVESIDWISPRPTSFRINLKNGQDYILKWTGKTFEAQILGKKYLLSNIAEYQQALDKLAILYKEAPMTGAGEGEPADTDTGGGGGGGGEFPGGEGGAEGGEEGGDEVDALGGEEGGEEPAADLGGEEIDFEDEEIPEA